MKKWEKPELLSVGVEDTKENETLPCDQSEATMSADKCIGCRHKCSKCGGCRRKIPGILGFLCGKCHCDEINNDLVESDPIPTFS